MPVTNRNVPGMPVYFRWHNKNQYSIAALLSLVPGASIAYEPHGGIMLYSFASAQAQNVYREVGSCTDSRRSIFIAGGPHPTGRPEDALSHFDYVVIGEGEEALPELVDALRNGTDVSKVRGIAFMKNGIVVKTGKREPVDLDKYPPFTPEVAYGSIEISRGCPYHCTYCQTPRIFGHDMRHRSIDCIVKYASYFNDVRFTTPNAFAYGSDGRHLEIEKLGKLLCALSENGRRIFFGTFPSEVRPGFITHKALELVTRYCANTAISMGAQSGSSRVLGEICRGHGVEDVVSGVEMCLEHGLVPVVDFIIGLPCESEHDQLASLKLIEWICAKGGKVRAHAFVPLPGTPLENRPPARIVPEVDRMLGKLALHGKLEGSWRVY